MKNNQDALNELTSTLAAEIKAGILPSTIKVRLINNGAPEELATKLARIAELKAAEWNQN